MSRAPLHEPHHPNGNVPEAFEPGALPVEPDEGPIPASIPDDPEHERGIDSAENQARQAQRARRQGEVGRCP